MFALQPEIIFDKIVFKIEDQQSFEMSLPQGHFETLLYILKINWKQVTGELVSAGRKN